MHLTRRTRSECSPSWTPWVSIVAAAAAAAEEEEPSPPPPAPPAPADGAAITAVAASDHHLPAISRRCTLPRHPWRYQCHARARERREGSEEGRERREGRRGMRGTRRPRSDSQSFCSHSLSPGHPRLFSPRSSCASYRTTTQSTASTTTRTRGMYPTPSSARGFATKSVSKSQQQR
jgi:hypothetical protein